MLAKRKKRHGLKTLETKRNSNNITAPSRWRRPGWIQTAEERFLTCCRAPLRHTADGSGDICYPIVFRKNTARGYMKGVSVELC